MLATDLAMALDPVLLARQAGFEPDPWQAQVLRSTARRMLLNCCRQSGKSTTTATLAMHTVLYEPGSLILLLSPSLRQSQELFRKCLDVYRALERPIPAGAESALRLELENGSRIVSLPGKEGTIRGYSGVRLLVIDEAARVLDELYRSVRPMLAVSGGRLVALSTPWGKRGWWYDEEERRSIGKLFFASEYLCEFVDTVDQLFSSDDVAAAITSEVKPLFGG